MLPENEPVIYVALIVSRQVGRPAVSARVRTYVGADTGRTIHTAEWLSGRPEPAQLDEMIAQLAAAATEEVIRRLGVQGVMPV
jgi:hypothetical protein